MEAKEGLPIQNESVTLASVSYQAFFRSFPKLAGETPLTAWFLCPVGFLGLLCPGMCMSFS